MYIYKLYFKCLNGVVYSLEINRATTTLIDVKKYIF